MAETLAVAGISFVDDKASEGPKPAGIPSQMQPLCQTVCSTGSEEIRILRPDEYKQAAQSLGEAFATDDVARYFIDTPDREHWSEADKWDLHIAILEYVTYAHCLKGLATTVGPNYGCVALWMPPGKNMDDLLTIMRSGLWRLQYQLSAEGKKRFFNEFLPLLHETKASILGPRDDDAWYLVYIGTRKEARGKGYARRLIEHVTHVADKEGRPCYLESSNDVNPIIYGKLGFQVKKKVHLQRALENISLDIMVREPKGGFSNADVEVKENAMEKVQ